MLFLLLAFPGLVLGSTFDLLMPGVTTEEPETYLCTGVKVTADLANMVGFNPLADMSVAHHMLLYGCEVPGYGQGEG